MPTKTRGQIAFEAYNNAGANPGRTFDGRPVPEWTKLTDDVRAKWNAAASAVIETEREAFEALAKAAGTPERQPGKPMDFGNVRIHSDNTRPKLTLAIRPPCPTCKTMECSCPPPPRAA